jgi:hypothetical protein
LLAENTASNGEAAGSFQPQSAVFTEQTQHRVNARWSNNFRGAFMPIEAPRNHPALFAGTGTVGRSTTLT